MTLEVGKMIFTINSKKHGCFGISVDDDCEALTTSRKWGVSYDSQGDRFYISNTTRSLNDWRSRQKFFLHRCIMEYTLSRKLHPKEHVDHINGDSTDNRIENLRVVDYRRNQQNQSRHRNGKLVGASFHNQTGKWRSQIKIGGKEIHLGLFDTEQQAHEAYLSALQEI